jgi:hypothetical protein
MLNVESTRRGGIHPFFTHHLFQSISFFCLSVLDVLRDVFPKKSGFKISSQSAVER